MDEQMAEKFDQWAYANLGEFANSDKHAVAWEAWQACAAALSQPAAAKPTCIMCHGTGKYAMATAVLPGQPVPEPHIVNCRQCTPKATP